ncbi:MAG: type II secretion system protein [Elusimicrobiaceae bacterium]|nr:type II secretion system protein [Elusimicrobiaceae bacterium]
MKKGFTLLEMLIVIMIIGVLTGFALPKYQTAVDQSRYSALIPLAKSVKDSQETFYMANGDYSSVFSGLDVQLPGSAEISGGTASLENGVNLEINIEEDYKFVKASKDGMDNNYVVYFTNSFNFPKEIHCEALTESQRANVLCDTMGGVKHTQKGNYTIYILDGIGAGTFSSTSGSPYVGWFAQYNQVPKNCSWSSSGSCYSRNTDDNSVLLLNQDQGNMFKYLIQIDGKEVYYTRYTASGSLYETVVYNEETGLYERTTYDVDSDGGSYTTTLYTNNGGFASMSGYQGIKETGTVTRGEDGNWVLSNGDEYPSWTNCEAYARKDKNKCD